MIAQSSDAFCQWTITRLWGCAPWVNQVQDYGWIVGTGFSFGGCAGSEGQMKVVINQLMQVHNNAVFIGSQADGDPLYQFEVFRPVNKYEGTLDGFEVAIQHLFDNQLWCIS